MNGASTTNVRTRNRSRGSVATRSQNNRPTLARAAFPLVATLNSAFSQKSKFAITTLMIDRQDSPELAEIKAKVEAIPNIEFQTLTDINNHLQDSNSRLEDYQRDLTHTVSLIQNEPEIKRVKQVQRVNRWFEKEKEYFETGGNEIIDNHAKKIDTYILFVQGAIEKVESKIEAIRILRDNTEYWKGFWDAVKDKLAPKISEAGEKLSKPVLVLVDWAVGLIVSYAIYRQAWEKEQLLEVLQTWELMLNNNLRLILKTKDEITNYYNSITKSEVLWKKEVYAIWFIKVEKPCGKVAIIQLENYIQTLKNMQTNLSLTIKPFEQGLSRIHPFYGSGLSVQRNVANFCRDVPYISIYLKKLLTAKGIICSDQEEMFEENIYNLSSLIYGRLERIEGLCVRRIKHIDPAKLSTFLEDESADFIRQTDRIIEATKGMLKTQTHSKKSEGTWKKRMDGDRRYKHWSWTNRPLVTSTSAIDVLEDLQSAIDTIHRVSISIGTGTNMSSTEELVDVQRLHVEFNRSDSLLGEFFKVLREEVIRGPNMERVTKTSEKTPHKKFGLSRLTAKLRRSKPEVLKVLESA